MAVYTSGHWQKLVESGRLRKYSKKQVIQTSSDGQAAKFVKSGYVKRYLITNTGAISTQVLYGPGDFFPLTLVYKAVLNQKLYRGPEIYYYETMCEAQIYDLQISRLIDEVQRRPVLYRDLMYEAGRRLNSNIQKLENRSLPNFYRRLAHQLLYYARKFGEPKGQKVIILAPLTQQDLADILDSTRETVSASMAKLAKKGLIEVKRQIVVTDILKLEQEAYG